MWESYSGSALRTNYWYMWQGRWLTHPGEETLHTQVQTVWFHLHEVLEKEKLSMVGKNHNSDVLWEWGGCAGKLFREAFSKMYLSTRIIPWELWRALWAQARSSPGATLGRLASWAQRHLTHPWYLCPCPHLPVEYAPLRFPQGRVGRAMTTEHDASQSRQHTPSDLRCYTHFLL